MIDFSSLRSWTPDGGQARYETIDMHTCGEPLRVIISGLPEIPGSTVLEKRRWFASHLDHVRTALMWEPRGHADMYGAVITASRNADFDLFFMHNEGYSTMCGHAVIALTRLVVESGMLPPNKFEILFDVPCGRISAVAHMADGEVKASSFQNVPSYVVLSEAKIDVPGLGGVRLDIAYGGAYYAIVDAVALGLGLDAANTDRLIDHGRRIKHAVAAAFPVEHPFEPDLSFIYGTIFTGPPSDAAHHSRNVCIFAHGEVDRSPTGSGVSARAALHFARGDIALGQVIRIESILGATMDVRVVELTRFGGKAAIVPEVTGQAFFTGRGSFCVEPDDPFGDGFLLR